MNKSDRIAALEARLEDVEARLARLERAVQVDHVWPRVPAVGEVNEQIRSGLRRAFSSTCEGATP